MTRFRIHLATFAVSAMLLAAGCSGSGTTGQSGTGKGKDDNTKQGKDDNGKGKTDNDKKGKDDHPHGHGVTGPHGGVLIELGDEEYHGEFTVDHKKKEVVVYILGGDAKKAVPIEAKEIDLAIKEPKFSIKLKAAPQEGDPAGQASAFKGTHDNFGKEQDFAGTVSMKIKDKPYVGEFEE
jgi:hypothetical protein